MSGYGSYGAYGGAATDVVGLVASTVSLIFIILSFSVLAYLAYRVKTFRSFQFQMFLFALILLIGDGPAILGALGVPGDFMSSSALLIHTASMIFLSGFIALRIYMYRAEGKRSS